MVHKISAKSLLKKIPGPVTHAWPDGEPFADGMAHGTMSLELFAPRQHDYQKPHAQDELYIVIEGLKCGETIFHQKLLSGFAFQKIAPHG